jgi:hypothetical protein
MPAQLTQTEKTDREKIGAQIRQQRLWQGLPLDSIAKAAGPKYDRRHAAKWEKGEAPLPKDCLLRIASALNIDLWDLTLPTRTDLPPRTQLLSFNSDGPLERPARRQAEAILVSTARKAHQELAQARRLQRFRLPRGYKPEKHLRPKHAEKLASGLRTSWNLGDWQVADVTCVLEDNHIVVADVPNPAGENVVIAGVFGPGPIVCWWGARPRTPDEIADYRLRVLASALRTIAHHRKLMLSVDDGIMVARALLLPADRISHHFGGREHLSAENVQALAGRYGLPVSATISRLIETHSVTPERYQTLHRAATGMHLVARSEESQRSALLPPA